MRQGSRFPIGTAEASRRWRQLGALTLRCGEKSSHQKTGLDVGIVKSAVADPADVLAGYVSKMWSQARNSFALDGLDGTWNFKICIPGSAPPGPPLSRLSRSIDVARRAPIWVFISEKLRSEILVAYIAITERHPVSSDLLFVAEGAK
jgi:hypothetical protein